MLKDFFKRAAIALVYLLAANNLVTTWEVVTRMYAPTFHIRFDPYWIRIFGGEFILLDVIVTATLVSMALVNLIFAVSSQNNRANLVYGIIVMLLNIFVAVDWIGMELEK